MSLLNLGNSMNVNSAWNPADAFKISSTVLFLLTQEGMTTNRRLPIWRVRHVDFPGSNEVPLF